MSKDEISKETKRAFLYLLRDLRLLAQKQLDGDAIVHEQNVELEQRVMHSIVRVLRVKRRYHLLHRYD